MTRKEFINRNPSPWALRVTVTATDGGLPPRRHRAADGGRFAVAVPDDLAFAAALSSWCKVADSEGPWRIDFTSEMWTEDDVHSPVPGDVTPYNFETRAASLAADLNEGLRDGDFNAELGLPADSVVLQNYRVVRITKAPQQDYEQLPFLEV
jgi:hypothetical protein